MQKMNNKQKPLLYDKQIIGRIRKCLEESSKKSLADCGTVTRLLQAKFPEYRRRRQGPFRKLVKQAYRIICEDLYENLNSGETEQTTESESEMDDEETPTPQPNVLNNIFQTMYKSGPLDPPKATKRKDSDVISLSSDEERSSPIDNNAAIETNENSARTVFMAPKAAVQEESNQNLVKKPTKRKEPQDLKQNTNRKRVYRMPVDAFKAEVNFENIGGIDDILKQLCEIFMNIVAPGYYLSLGAKPPKGILLYGPTGCGKTLLAEAIAGQLDYPFITITATELITGVTGESEERIRELFEQAIFYAPCVLFIDEIDAIGSDRMTAEKEMQRRITSQLITCFDTLKEKISNDQILVVGATSRPDVLDTALRRHGRFDYEIAIPVPDRKGRFEILECLCRNLKIKKFFSYDKIAELTPGYVAADFVQLVSRACANGIKRMWLAAMFEKEHRNTPSPTVDLDENNDNVKKMEEKMSSNENDNDSDSNCDVKKNEDKMTSNENDNDSDSNCDATNNTKEIEVKQIANSINDTINVMNSKKEIKIPINWKPSLKQLLDYLNDLPPEDINIKNYTLNMEDFMNALKSVQPSAKREGFATVPDVTWNDIGSLHDIRDQLRLAILAPVKHPITVKSLGLQTPAGVLLCGPPGCGKTLIAKAIANEAGINFISVKGPEMMNMYVGESERAVRECFQRARNSAPCVIFFDEFDSLCSKRSGSSDGSSGVRIVNQLLTEMDGVVERKGVYVLAATNRPDIIDPAILRPGRLDTILYVGMPDEKARYEILQAATKNGKRPVLHEDVDFKEIARLTDGYTGADLSGLIRQASLLSLKNAVLKNLSEEEIFVTFDNIKEAMRSIRPSVSERDRKTYEELRTKYASKAY